METYIMYEIFCPENKAQRKSRALGGFSMQSRKKNMHVL